jgi:hypothetical protein
VPIGFDLDSEEPEDTKEEADKRKEDPPFVKAMFDAAPSIGYESVSKTVDFFRDPSSLGLLQQSFEL